MPTAVTAPEFRERLDQLGLYLEVDPKNLLLLSEAAVTAFRADELDQASTFLNRYTRLHALTPTLLNLSGLIALRTNLFEVASSTFEALVLLDPDPELCYNLAWARAMLGDYEAALSALGDPVGLSFSAAAVLRIRMLHHLGRLADALSDGEGLLERFPQARDLSGALAAVAMDAGDADRARAYAVDAENDPDGLATLGALLLDDGEVAVAGSLFDRALTVSPNNARALLGKGLELMADGRAAAAAEKVDRAAELFRTHLGSWIAAGWAHYVTGDVATSRKRFETAVRLDDRFAEAHGALAVLDIAEGRVREGERQLNVALRLDRTCLSAALAKIMLLERQDQAGLAHQVRETVMNRPLDSRGRTLSQALTTMGGKARPLHG